jgi:hypothetical protein
VLDWLPVGRRSRGRPTIRWKDNLNAFFKSVLGEAAVDDESWKGFALDREGWKLLEEDFARRHWS